MTDKALRGPRVQRVLRGTYVSAGVELDARVRALAALRLAPTGSVAARATAAVLLGAVVPHDTRVHLRMPAGQLRLPGVDARVRRGRRPHALVRGVPVTTAEDTFVDLTAELDLVDLVVLGDSLVRRGRTSPERLVAVAARLRGRHARLARRAAGFVRAGVDSPMESRLRMLLVLAGLPEPAVNHIECDEWGRWLRRYDLSWPELRVAVEYDGRQHAESQRQWERDVERREELDLDGWRIVVVLSKGVYREPERTLDRVVAALRARGVRARVTSDEWRLHFLGRG
ncbi:DUF559 domain-containing protein [Pedococcus sp. 2YAF34]|uniref:DUF559 domain-containing protein n=1 Tax=Pedococcus sp. 2YAF34 TaxID=3233032 RepID=UPI003F9D4A3C